MILYIERYSAWDEIIFLRWLALRNPSALAKYAAIVRGGYRQWDDGVEVGTVLRVLDEVTGKQ